MSRARGGTAEIGPPPPTGRIFEKELRPGVADAAPSGRARLDAIARWLQDMAYLDIVDAGLEHRGAWIVRRSRIRVEAAPSFGEDLLLRTFCSGIGRFCAERRTVIEGATASVDAVAIWVCLEPERQVPMRFDDEFSAVYAESARGRGASVRLRHPSPPAEAERGRWTFDVTDLDVAGHVNNSHYWRILESELCDGSEPVAIDAEIEHLAPAQPGEAAILRAGDGIWVADGEGEVLASIRRLGSGV